MITSDVSEKSSQSAKQPSKLCIALVGNPNTGKSTLFNRLTGSRQRVGNYPGVTVSRKSGEMWSGAARIEVLDLPGAYSLAASSPDERISSDVIAARVGASPSLVICTVDATHLQRGLFLACQIADLGMPLIIAVNFMDEAAAKGLELNFGLLSRRLGVPVLPISARTGAGLGELRDAITAGIISRPILKLPPWSEELHCAVSALQTELGPSNPLAEGELRRVIFDMDSSLLDVAGCRKDGRHEMLTRVRSRLSTDHPMAFESNAHHQFLGECLTGVVSRHPSGRAEITHGIDRILTHRIFGLLIFAALMFLVFQAIYTFATPAMSGIEAGAAWLAESLGRALEPFPLFKSLVCDGIITGVGGVIVFLPQIFLLFFFVSLMEDTGYMARAAFLMDKLFGWCGLNGKSFVPLLSSYACAIPGLYATRTIEDPKARILTILVAPLMSCSARLPVYLLMIGAFVAPKYGPTVAALTLFAFHIIGLVIALPLAWAINVWFLKIGAQPFVLEMPPYRFPAFGDLFWRVWLGGRDFLQRAGGIILALSVIIWASLSFPTMPDATPATQVENSYLGRAGKFLQPVFAPAGYDWKLTIGVLASFPAREVIVSTLGIIYRLEDDETEDFESLAKAMRSDRWTEGARSGQPVFTIATALSIMVFFALCMQCASTLAVTAREAGTRYAVITFLYMTTLAWVAAVLTFQVVSRL